jgi:hypothetical protein
MDADDVVTGDAVQRLEAARSRIDRVCTWLASPNPEMLDRCSGMLQSTISELVNPGSWLTAAQGNPDALAEAWELQRAVRRAGKLVQHASEYQRNRMRTVGRALDGYGPDRGTSAVIAPSRIYLHG